MNKKVEICQVMDRMNASTQGCQRPQKNVLWVGGPRRNVPRTCCRDPRSRLEFKQRLIHLQVGLSMAARRPRLLGPIPRHVHPHSKPPWPEDMPVKLCSLPWKACGSHNPPLRREGPGVRPSCLFACSSSYPSWEGPNLHSRPPPAAQGLMFWALFWF